MKKNQLNSKNFLDLLEEPTPPRVGSFKEIQGDLISLAKIGEFDFIGHGCNCFSTMGAGIAKSIALNFPEALEIDKALKLTPLQKLGNFSIANHTVSIPPKGKFTRTTVRVLNFYSQHYPGPAFDKESLILALRKFTIWHADRVFDAHWKIGLPLIGCGIGGGDWEEVKELIKKELHQFDVTIVHFKEK